MKLREPLYDPFITPIFVASTVLSAAATTAAGVSSYQQGQANAKIAEQQGEATKRAQKMNETLYREEADSLLSEQIAANAAGGAAADSSSLLYNLIDTEWKYLRDQRRREYEAELGISRAHSEASLHRRKATADLTGSLLGAAGNAGLQATNFALAKKG